MISLKSFITAIHDALVSANNSLMDANVLLLDKYFIETPNNLTDPISGQVEEKATLVPRSVTLQYPHVTSSGQVENVDVSVPLITLVPITMSQVEKATFTLNFEMDVVEGELQLNFANGQSKGLFGKEPKIGSLELTLSPRETPEGLRILVEGYDAILRRQIS